jgi:steroid 5-alpha reductase family enzyme
MNRLERISFAAIPLIIAIGTGIAWAGSQGSIEVSGFPLFALCAIASFAINWVVFIPAYVFQTERFFDLTGSVTYVSLIAGALLLQDAPAPRAWLLGGMVAIWALRLGSFLFLRIRRDGSDGRFDDIKTSFPRFSMTWTLQGLWVVLTLSCALAAMTSASPKALDGAALVGTLLWALGFGIEVVADRQKGAFRANAKNHDRFIQSGLWAWSRHPNYFGEILLWIGAAVIALPVLHGWQYATLISPVFVYVLLTRISGIPLLESRGKHKWGEDPEYRAYKARTSVLFPRSPRGVS